MRLLFPKVGSILEDDINMSKIDDYGFTDFIKTKDGWSEYTLEDGTIIRTYVLLLKIVKNDIDFNFNERTFATSFSPPALKGPVGSSKILPGEEEEIAKSLKKEDINVIVSKEYWNEYELSTGDKVSAKAVLVSASMTDRYDDVGDPIYAVQIQVLHKIIQKKDDKKAK